MKKGSKKEVTTSTNTTVETILPAEVKVSVDDNIIINDMIKHSVLNEPPFDATIMYRVGNITITKVSLEQIKQAIVKKDITNVLDFLEMFIKEAEKNKEQYKKPTEAIVSPVSNNRQKEIKYNDVDGNLKYMTGDIIDLRDEISPDNHIKRILRIALTSADHTNIEVPVKSLVTTPDPKFAVIRRLSEFVYEITEYVR